MHQLLLVGPQKKAPMTSIVIAISVRRVDGIQSL